MNDLFEKIEHYCTHHNLLERGATIIMGLSGGPDSVLLLHVLAWLQKPYDLTLIAAHLDHQWRPTSVDDSIFCKKLCDELNIPLVLEKAENITVQKKGNGGSKEEEGRLLRRTFFEQLAQQYHAAAIALGHHADDQQETFFIRLIRGSSLSGLVGIRPRSGRYIRPLLFLHKHSILTYLTTNNMSYREDPTNVQEDFLRNCIRHKVIPAARSCDERFDQNFFRTHASLEETEDYLIAQTEQLFATLSSCDTQLRVNMQAFLAVPHYMQKRLLVLWFIKEGVPFTPSTGLLEEVIRFLKNKKSTRHTIYPEWSLIKLKGHASISHN